MTTTTVQKASPLDAGCWIDGHWGQYGVIQLIDIARSWGMELSVEDQRALTSFQHDGHQFISANGLNRYDTFEWILGQGGLGDDAENWMNDNIAPEGFSFGWEDGEFFLLSNEIWSDEFSSDDHGPGCDGYLNCTCGVIA